LSVRQQVSFSVVIFLALSFVDLKGPPKGANFNLKAKQARDAGSLVVAACQ
jgi:hypothetical protein